LMPGDEVSVGRFKMKVRGTGQWHILYRGKVYVLEGR